MVVLLSWGHCPQTAWDIVIREALCGLSFGNVELRQGGQSNAGRSNGFQLKYLRQRSFGARHQHWLQTVPLYWMQRHQCLRSLPMRPQLQMLMNLKPE